MTINDAIDQADSAPLSRANNARIVALAFRLVDLAREMNPENDARWDAIWEELSKERDAARR